jgi:transcriptional regulator with XRE-family HTH domain
VSIDCIREFVRRHACRHAASGEKLREHGVLANRELPNAQRDCIDQVDGRSMARLSMLELGRRLGVDRATVSRALSEDKAHLVAAATRERIRTEATRLGFSPDAAAATLRRGRSRTIGILTPDLLNEVLVRVIRGTVAYLNRNTAEASRIIPLIGETGDRPEEFRRLLRAFLARRVDAIVSLASTEKHVHELIGAAKQVPVVLAVRSLSGAAFPSQPRISPHGGTGSFARFRGRAGQRPSRTARKVSPAFAARRSSSNRRGGSR